MNKLLCASVVALLSLSAAVAHGADAERAQIATETRQGLLKVVVSYFGPIVGMARQQIPYDAAVVQSNAEQIAVLLPMIPDVFRMDTRGADVDTEALDGIWENMDDFAEKTQAATEAAQALAAAAGQSQEAAMGAFRQLGGACKGCHDEYRQQD